ncbi:hypothetical protein IB259_12170 [Achromobacter sp. ACM04]|uniref:Uncharacterized protein n=1 Tax=Achromobacter aegrifaciens TaxID=1287736 RepID=A0AAD2KJ57_ACHAE|nr:MULTISPECIES: hypothetical protein [Achromobacter]MBD9420012.1 hypothetical protein [Achromobacter sp. ACM04]MBD9431113.1 hypothetical protein [Achromobacter sp. ACM03]CAB3811534.1 hypothetical protein LMG26854_00084 [Achromobacter aegrifaciens]CUI66195.1 Uncharacterised protein [Achromobacter aegrifaciens]
MAFLLFPVLFAASLLISLAAGAVHGRRHGWKAPATRRWLFVAGCLVLSYLVGLALVIHDPYFDDNGVPEFIPWRFRWTWAWLYAGLLQFAVVPSGLALRRLARRKTASAAQ